MTGKPSPSPLLLVIDIGNTNTVFGVFLDDRLVHRFRLSTESERTADEYSALLLPLLGRLEIDPGRCDGVAISSVVPALSGVFGQVSRGLFGREPMLVEPGIRTAMPIRYENPAEVGADRICNAVAARDLYGAPSVVVDFGTALTFDIVGPDGAYGGGIIAPGPEISAEALFSHASRLYSVDFRKPERLIGKTTAGAMRSGIFYGFVALVDGILERLVAEIEGLDAIVATGGSAPLIAGESRYIREIEPDLTLLGLKTIYDRNR